MRAKPKNKLYEDLLSSIRPSVTPSDGIALSIGHLEKLATQTKLLESLSPYMSSQQEADFKKSILEQMLGNSTGMIKEEKEPEGRSLKEFLDTLK